MQVVIPCSGVSRIAYVRNGLALFREVTFSQTFGISIEMRVVVDKLVVSAQLIDRGSASFALKQFHDGSVRSRDYGRPPRRGNINRIMNAPFGTTLGKRVTQLVWSYPSDWNNQVVR